MVLLTDGHLSTYHTKVSGMPERGIWHRNMFLNSNNHSRKYTMHSKFTKYHMSRVVHQADSFCHVSTGNLSTAVDIFTSKTNLQ